MSTKPIVMLFTMTAVALALLGCPSESAPLASDEASELNIIKSIDCNDLPLQVPVFEGAILEREIYFGYLREIPDVETSYTLIMWTDSAVEAAWFYDGVFYERTVSKKGFEGRVSQEISLQELKTDKLGVLGSVYELQNDIEVTVIIHGKLSTDPPPDESNPFGINIAVAKKRAAR